MADYPGHPGSKGSSGTSKEAAEAITPMVAHLRKVALAMLDQLGEATPLECCEFAGLPRETLEPRFSELRAIGLIEPTAERRRNPSGRSAAVLRLTDKGKAAL